MSVLATPRGEVGVAARRAHAAPVPIRLVGLALAGMALVAVFAASLALGAADLDMGNVISAFTAFDGSTAHLIVTELRLPRTLLGAAVGAALGLSGTVMQGITRNPLAEPGILGVNSGAALAVALGIMGGVATAGGHLPYAIAGAAVASVVVYALGTVGRGRPSVVRLALAGSVVAAFCASLTSAVLILDQSTLDRFRFWEAGSIAGQGWDVLWAVLPILAIGALLALPLGRALNAVALGDELARSLGQRLLLIRLVGATAIVLLAGGSVAAAGPIVFAGLAVPHIARLLIGPDYRWVLPYSALIGAALLIGADLIGRVIARPSEVEVGIITALLGAPIFIWLVRRRGRVEL